MANRDFASIDAALATIFENQVAPQINRSVVSLQVLPSIPADGKNISWDAKFGTATPTTAAIGDGTAVTVFNADDKVPAVLNFTTYHDAFLVTGRASAASAAAGNPNQLSNLFRDDLRDSVNRLARAIGADFYLGTGASNKMLGILDATSGGIIATGTYAGLSRSTYTQWAGNLEDAGGSELGFTLIRNLIRKIYVASGMKPDLFICDPTQHEKLGLLYGAQRRYVDSVRIQGQVIKLDGGYNVLEFDGRPVIEDVQAPAQKFIALNTTETRMRYLPQPSAEQLQGSVGDVAIAGSAEAQFGMGAVKFMGRLKRLADDGDSAKFATFVYPQVQVRTCNANGYISNLAA